MVKKTVLYISIKFSYVFRFIKKQVEGELWRETRESGSGGVRPKWCTIRMCSKGNTSLCTIFVFSFLVISNLRGLACLLCRELNRFISITISSIEWIWSNYFSLLYCIWTSRVVGLFVFLGYYEKYKNYSFVHVSWCLCAHVSSG
jgi:hypothetical protein